MVDNLPRMIGVDIMEKIQIMYLLKNIGDQAKVMIDEINKWRTDYIKNADSYHLSGRTKIVLNNITNKIIEAKQIINEYNTQSSNATKILKIELHPIYLINNSEGGVIGYLKIITIRCNSTVEFIRHIISPISLKEANKLQSLREQLEKISSTQNMEIFLKNIGEAIKEYESSHFLASALISSRSIIYIIDQIKGTTDEDKINTLIRKKVISKKRKDITINLIKACRKSRNYFSHDIKISPDPSDSLSLLGDSVNLLQYYVSYIQSIESK